MLCFSINKVSLFYENVKHNFPLQTILPITSQILFRYKLSKVKIKSFQDHKQQNGPFKSLDEVLEVEGFRDDYLQELCRRILTNKLTKPRVGVSKTNRFFKQLLEPEIDKEFSNVRIGLFSTKQKFI